MMANERRRNRSELPHEAARLYLDAMAARSGLRALALASDDGLLVAGTRGDYDCEGLAAIGVARENKLKVRRELVDAVTRGDELHASRMDIAGSIFYLTSVGSSKPRAEDAVGALHRILAPALPSRRSQPAI